MIAVRYVILSILIVASCNSLHAEEPVTRDIWKMQLTGNAYYNADGIRTGLSLDQATQVAAADGLPMDQYLDLLRQRIILGYQSNGFRDVQVSMNLDQATGVITSHINEGQQWMKGEVAVAGLTERECEYVESLMTQKSDHSNPLQEKQPKLKFWSTESELSFVEPVEGTYHSTVQEAITAIGYPQALFTVACQAVSKEDEHSVDLQVTVIDTGVTLTVGEIIMTGLEKHSREQLIEFLELKPGMPLTLPMRERIVSKLLDSGRFLMAEVTHEPFYFDPSEPLDLTIRVREYDEIAAVGQDATDVQKTLIKTSEWLEKWGESNNDIHVRLTGPTEQANEVVKSFVPEQYHPFCNPALGTGNPGTVCIDLLTSSKLGSVLMFQVTDAQGVVSTRRTILLTESMQGLLAWQNKKKWLKDGQVSLFCTLKFAGQWPNEANNRALFFFGYGFNSKPGNGLRSEFIATAAAVVHLFHDQIADFKVDGDLCKLTLKTGTCELDHETGAIRNINTKIGAASIEVTSGTDLVATELSRLKEETKHWANQCQPGREWPVLASMILDDVKSNEWTLEDLTIGETKIDEIDSSKINHTDVFAFLLDFLSDEAVLDRWSKGAAQLKKNRTFRIPQDNSRPPGTVPGWLGYLAILVEFVPAGTFPHRLGLTTIEAQSTGNHDPAKRVLSDLLEKKENGAIYCELIARLHGDMPPGSEFAKAGLQRLSTAEFQQDIAPFLDEPNIVREVICCLLVWLQQTTDDEAEKIAKLIEKCCGEHHAQPLNIRHLLALIRSQPAKSTEEVLASLVPFVWEGGLRSRVEADLKDLAAAVPKEQKKHFGAASQDIIQSISMPKQKEPARKSKSPVKSASNPNSLKDIKLDDQWDLDGANKE
ncbi:MAG: hypothetical protein WKF77_20735 [Planctomycetaceae bacterium]